MGQLILIIKIITQGFLLNIIILRRVSEKTNSELSADIIFEILYSINKYDLP